MRNIQNGDTLCSKVTDHLHQDIGLGLRQRGCRLVHDQQPRIHQQRAGDFHQLLFAHPQILDLGIDIQGKAKARQHIHRQSARFIAVNEQSTNQRLTPEDHILRHRHFGDQAKFLMHDDDAVRLGLAWIAKNCRGAFNRHGAKAGRNDAADDFDQRRFPRAIFTHQGVNFAAADRQVDA